MSAVNILRKMREETDLRERLTVSEVRAAAFVPLIAIYRHPADFPEMYVARLWDLGRPTPLAVAAGTYEELMDRLPCREMVKMPRHPKDDPVIVEVWM